MDYWNDEWLEGMVENYRENRDPAPLTKLIHIDYEAMQAPAIGRLFLDIINGRLPPLEHRAGSTSEIRGRAVRLVLFYLGSNMKKSKAYAAAGLILGRSDDTIKGYVDDWLEGFCLWGWPDDAITKSDFWANPEKYLGKRLACGDGRAFRDGRAMLDDSLARKKIANLAHRDTAWYRSVIKDLYEKQEPTEFDDPWVRATHLALLEFERRLSSVNKKEE